MATQERTLVFDYQVSRFVMGVIALTLPAVVTVVARTPLTSISASYYTHGRNEFVGMLFVVAAFLLAYNGYTTRQSIASKLASLAAILVALFPTNCDTCDITSVNIVHYCSATTLFAILTFFCFGPFRKRASDKAGDPKANENDNRKKVNKPRRRKRIYLTCGIIMIVCIASLLIYTIVSIIMKLKPQPFGISFWSEAVALAAFGVAWMTASRPIGLLAEKDEKMVLFKR